MDWAPLFWAADRLGRARAKEEILKARNAIRKHRDAVGDDRCWLDDDLVYQCLPGYKPITTLCPRVEFLKKCRIFKERRCGWRSYAPGLLRVPLLESGMSDEDIDRWTVKTLRAHVLWLWLAIQNHHDCGDNKTSFDDILLYLVLPDGIEPNLSLPPELLDNCGRFYNTRPCPLVDPKKLHEW